MRIGVMSGATPGPDGTLDGIVARAKDLEARGFHSIWMANIFGLDAITAQAIVGRETSKIELGTAVVPTYPRHPSAIAQQTLTTQAACGGRFVLGIGLSHKLVIEDMLGMSYAQPAKHMREYLSVLMPLARGETANFEGEHYTVRGVALGIPGADRLPVVVAALGPVMLKIAAELADGTNTWMVGPNTMENHIIAGLRKHGLDTPRIVAGVPMLLTDKPDDVRATLGGITINQTGRELEGMLLLGAFYLSLSLLISGVMNLYNNATQLKER